jgi:hypothetical protein
MKLRIKGNFVRIRVDQNDLDKLKSTGIVKENTEFPGGTTFSYELIQFNGSKLDAAFNGSTICVSIPETYMDDWIHSEKVGFDEKLGELRILIEKDFQCLIPREGEDTAGFPNPLQHSEK